MISHSCNLSHHCSKLLNKHSAPKLTCQDLQTPKCSKFDTSLQFGGNFCAKWAKNPCFFLRIWQKWSQDLWLTCDQNEIWLKNPRLIHHLLSVSQTKLEIPEIKVIFLYIPCAEPRGTLHTLRGHSNVLTPSPHHPQHLHHLSCSSFRLAWYFLQLSCSTMGASGSVCLRGVESACRRGPSCSWILNTGAYTLMQMCKWTTASAATEGTHIIFKSGD